MTDEMLKIISAAVLKELERQRIAMDELSPPINIVTLGIAVVEAYEKSLAKAGLGIRPREATDAMDAAGTNAFEKLDVNEYIYQRIADDIWQAMWDGYEKPDG